MAGRCEVRAWQSIVRAGLERIRADGPRTVQFGDGIEEVGLELSRIRAGIVRLVALAPANDRGVVAIA